MSIETPTPPLRETSEERLERFEEESADWLQQVWSDRAELGEESELCIGATKHWEKMLAHASPFDPRITERFNAALHKAWWAVWRARDYTLQGWHERARRHNRPLSDFIWEGGAATVFRFKNNWPCSHVPLVGPDGISDVASYQSVLKDLADSRRKHAFEHAAKLRPEGMVALDELSALIPTTAELRWAFLKNPAGPAPSIRSCWVAEEPGAPTIVSGVSVQQSVVEGVTYADRFTFGDENGPNWEQAHFLGGLVFRDAKTKTEANFPNTIDCGPFVKLESLIGPARSLSFGKSQGVKAIYMSDCSFSLLICELRLRQLHVTGNGVIDGNQVTNLGDVGVSDSTVFSARLEKANLQLASFVNVKVLDEIAIRRSKLNGTLRLQDLSVAHNCKSLGDGLVDAVRDVNANASGGPLSLVPSPNRPGMLFDHIEVGAAQITNLTCEGSAILRFLKCQVDFRISATRFGQSVDLTEISSPKFRIGDQVGGSASQVLGDFNCSSSIDSDSELGDVLVYDLEVLGVLKFENRKFGGSTAFERCKFLEAPRFHSAEMNQDTSFRASEFNWRDRLKNLSGPERNAWLGQTERAFRALAQHMEKIRASELMSWFHSEQMQARHLRERDPDVGIDEKFLGHMYGVFSGYGGSIAIPFYWLAVIWLTSTAFYFGLGCGFAGWFVDESVPRATLGTSFLLAMTIMFRPFYQFSPAFGRVEANSNICAAEAPCETTSQLAAHFVQNHEVTFKLFASLQSVCSVVLIFLFLLAIRRKFQLN